MSDLLFIDSAYPMPHPPHSDGVCLYSGGDTLHVWSKSEVDAQPARYRLPIFVRSNPPGPGAASDVAAMLAYLEYVGAPKGILVCWDAEVSADPSYIRGVYEGMRDAGYPVIVYGSQGYVFGNENPDGLYFGADWTGSPHIDPGDVMTQYRALAAYDEDEAKATLPFWDTRPPKPKPKPKPKPLPVFLTALYGGDEVFTLAFDAAGIAYLSVPPSLPGGTKPVSGVQFVSGPAQVQVAWDGGDYGKPVSMDWARGETTVTVPTGGATGGKVQRLDKGLNFIAATFV